MKSYAIVFTVACAMIVIYFVGLGAGYSLHSEFEYRNVVLGEDNAALVRLLDEGWIITSSPGWGSGHNYYTLRRKKEAKP